MKPLTLVLTASAALSSHAGPITPPPGPVTSTHKTLSDVEPRIAINATNTPGDADSLFKITLPGSYYLAGNVTGVSGKHGIEIDASNVTIDLNGFSLTGVAGALRGISGTATSSSVAIHNGHVRGWPEIGVIIQGVNATVVSVASTSNEQTGIGTGVSSVVKGCLASSNGGIGIGAGSNSVVVESIAYLNASIGISAGGNCVVSGCAARENASTGISTGFGATVVNSIARANENAGINAGLGSSITNCSAFENAFNGIIHGGGGIVSACSASENGAVGIAASTATVVTDCAAVANVSHGITAVSDSVVTNNLASANGTGGDGSGISVTGNDCRVEGNNCQDNDRGVRIASTGNIIIRNTCSGNATANWDIVAGNTIGPIVVSAATGAAILGSGPAPSTLGSTDPNANFSY